MRQAIAVFTFVFVLPGTTHAQLDIRLPSLDDPALRARLGPYSVAATLGARGIDLRVDDRVTASRRTPRIPEPTGGGTGRRAPTPTGGGTSPAPTPTGGGTRTNASAAAILDTADDYLGVPYLWGGTTPRGFDCSGFVQYVFRRHGVQVPRTSRQQAMVGQPVGVTLRGLRPGDLMFFASNGSRIDHVAIYAGNNEIIHSSSSGGGVGYDNLSSRRGAWFVNHHVATRRLLANGMNLVGELTAALRTFTRGDLDPADGAPRR